MDALPSDEAIAVAAPAALRRGSFVIAMVVAISLLYRNVTKAGALKLPRSSYRPRAWSERGKVTWEQIRAAAPPPTAPFALVFWTTSWLAYGLMAYYATRVATWTVLGLFLGAGAHIQGRGEHERCFGHGSDEWSGHERWLRGK